jgi:hypothetical protein
VLVVPLSFVSLLTNAPVTKPSLVSELIVTTITFFFPPSFLFFFFQFSHFVQGDITYGGIAANNFERYQGETIYTAEEDVHFPTLTVRQTLMAALKCKAPHKRANEQTRKVFVDRLMNMLLQIFGLTKQIDTVCANWRERERGDTKKSNTHILFTASGK